MTNLDLIVGYWPYALGVASAIAGLVAFVSQLLQVQKLKIEVARLKKQDEKDKMLVQVASAAEIERFGRPMASPASSRRNVLILSLMLLLAGPTLLLKNSFDDRLNAPPEQGPDTETEQAFAEAWLALLDTDRVGAAWRLLAPEWKSRLSEQDFADTVRKGRPTFGLKSARRLVSRGIQTDQQTGARLEVLLLAATTQDGANVLEIISLSRGAGALRVSSYNFTAQP